MNAEEEWMGEGLAREITGKRVLWYQTSYYSDDCHVLDLKLKGTRENIEITDLFDSEYTPIEFVVQGVETRSVSRFDDNYFWSTKVTFPGEAYIHKIELGTDYDGKNPNRIFIGSKGS